MFQTGSGKYRQNSIPTLRNNFKIKLLQINQIIFNSYMFILSIFMCSLCFQVTAVMELWQNSWKWPDLNFGFITVRNFVRTQPVCLFQIWNCCTNNFHNYQFNRTVNFWFFICRAFFFKFPGGNGIGIYWCWSDSVGLSLHCFAQAFLSSI